MEKNVAGQKWIVYAFDRTDNTPKTGDASNITANVSIDGAAGLAVTDTNPTEIGEGYYVFDMAQSEVNGDLLLISPSSSTSDIQVIGVPGAVWTTAPNYNALGIESDGDLTKVNTLDGHTAQTGDNYARIGSPANADIAADIAAVKTQTASIETDTQDIQTQVGTAGAGLTAIPTVARVTLVDTVTTSTYLTNAPTSGDFTSTMKGSITAACDASCDTVTVTRMAANVITSSVIATDAIDADAVKADVTTQIQSGLATSTELSAVQTHGDSNWTAPSANEVANKVAAISIDGVSLDNAIAIIAAAAAGAITTAGQDPEVFLGLDGTTTRLRSTNYTIGNLTPTHPVTNWLAQGTSSYGVATRSRIVPAT